MPVEINSRTAPPARGVPGAIDSLFVPALITDVDFPTDRAVSVRSVGDLTSNGIARADAPALYDGLDNYFREGGRQAYVAAYAAAAGFEDSLGLFTKSLGGGQVVAWNETADAATQAILLDYAQETQRFALLDVALDDDTPAALQVVADAVPALNNDYGAAFGPWVEIPAPAGIFGGGARQVPASSTVAALIARADSLGNPNRAPAGRDFPLQYATGFVGAPMTDADATTLRDHGLNPLRENFNLDVLDGFQTTRDQNPDDAFWQANCARARMWLQWQALNAGLNYEYKTIDGRGRLARALKTDLDVIGKQLWLADGLFGETLQEAWSCEVGVSVNTESTIAQGELHAVCEARFSEHAKTVVIDLVSVPVTGRVSAAA